MLIFKQLNRKTPIWVYLENQENIGFILPRVDGRFLVHLRLGKAEVEGYAVNETDAKHLADQIICAYQKFKDVLDSNLFTFMADRGL